jgi:hypothetical protein
LEGGWVTLPMLCIAGPKPGKKKRGQHHLINGRCGAIFILFYAHCVFDNVISKR